MWPQMIDTMFWPFAFKAAAERHNCLSLNSQGLTPNAVLHGIPLDAIPVKTYPTLFCPVYVLDARAQKKLSLKWFEKLKQGLMDREFYSLAIDPCLHLKANMILLTYVDDCIIFSPSMELIDRLVQSMHDGPENFKFTDEGDVNKFLGIDITRIDPSSLELFQPFLIDQLLQFFALCNNSFETDANSSLTPVTKGLLHCDLVGKLRKYKWKYRTAVGMLSYLQNSTRPEIAMAVHQTARFSNKPMLSHEKAIMRLGRYLLDTRKRGIIYKPDWSKPRMLCRCGLCWGMDSIRCFKC